MVTRLTLPTSLVLRVFLNEPDAERYGIEITDAAGLPSGTIHPILARLEGAGWLTSRWEDVDPREAGRPARRYYRLTDTGLREGGRRLAAARPVPRLALVARPVQQ